MMTVRVYSSETDYMAIDKGKPIPSKVYGNNRKYEWAEMSVNDSIFVEGKSSTQLLSAARNWANNNNKKHWQFTARKEGIGARIWRVTDKKQQKRK